MKNYTVFDILGPAMIGPSSSHTAGACRLALAAYEMAAPDFKKAVFYLHGSFAKTYRGHGTDRALLAGLMGFLPDDERLKNAFCLADEKNLTYAFIPKDLGNVHPNSVKIELTYADGKVFSLTGSSIGGGNIRIVRLGDTAVDFDLKRPTLVFQYQDAPGIIYKISRILAAQGYNIESIKTQKDQKGVVTLTLETTEKLPEDIVCQLLDDRHFTFARSLQQLQ